MLIGASAVLLEAADKLNCAEHAFAGAPMRHRIVSAMEIACQFFEMLKIQNRHVVWDTHQIIIPAEYTKHVQLQDPGARG